MTNNPYGYYNIAHICNILRRALGGGENREIDEGEGREEGG